MGNLLYGRDIAQKIHNEITAEIKSIYDVTKIEPTIAIITVGKGNALKMAEIKLHSDLAMKLGIKPHEIILEQTASEDQLVDVITNCNTDSLIHGILLLLPLPEHINQTRVLSMISMSKELEGLNEVKNKKNIFDGKQICVISAMLMLLNSVNLDIFNTKNVFIVEDNILEENSVVQKIVELSKELCIPINMLVTSDKNAHSISREADLLAISVETPNFVDEKYVKDRAVIVDFNPIQIGEEYSKEKGKIVPVLTSGVNIESVIHKVKYIVPSIGGIGPISLANLMKNFLFNYKNIVKFVT